jgi:ribosomal protein L40E
MFIPQCLFCDHTNSADAKYCNKCGAPLHLKLCKQCEAVNVTAAKACYKCGTALAARVSTSDAAAATPGGGKYRHSNARQRRSRARSPVAMRGERGELRRTRAASEASASDAISGVEAIACASQPSNTYGSPLCETRDTNPSVASPMPGTIAPRRQRFRVAMGALVPITLLYAVAGYYAYHDSLHLSAQVSPPPSTVPQPSAVEASIEASVVPQPEPVSASGSTLDAKPPKLVTSVRERQRTLAEHVAVPPVQKRATVAAKTPEPVPVLLTAVRVPEPSPGLHEQLTRCTQGSVFEQVLCDQRVRIAYCEGRWGRVTECPSGRVADYGQ